MSNFGFNSLNSTSAFSLKIKIKNESQQPVDSVQCIVMDPYNFRNHGFATGGWDGCLRYYEISDRNVQEIQRQYQRFLEHPIISVCFIGELLVAAGLCTGDIVVVSMKDDQVGVIGSHKAMICKVFYVEKYNFLISLGFDSQMKFWSLDFSKGTQNLLAQQYQFEFKTHTACYDYPYLFIGTACGKVAMMTLSNLPNIFIPKLNECYQIMQLGSKYLCSRLNANNKWFSLCCADGRCIISVFEDHNGLRPTSDSNGRLVSKSMKKENNYGQYPMYSQVNDVDIGFHKNQVYLVIAGTEEVSFFNMRKKDKPKRIKGKVTAGCLTLDGRYYVWAEGNDWSEGIYDLKNKTKTKLQAVKFTDSELESLVTDRK